MKRYCYLILFWSCFLMGNKLFGQTIQIGTNFNTGTYGKGSSITIPISLSGVFNQNEVFEIWLSDANGNFTSATKIGNYSGFFTTFVNGTLPTTGITDGNGYKIQVRASTTGANIATTPAFSISSTEGVIAKISLIGASTLKSDEIFGRCAPSTNSVSILTQSTPSSANTTITIKNEISGTTINPVISFTPTKTYYTITVTSEQNGIIGTKSYLFLNSDNINPLRSTYRSPICIDPKDPSSGALAYQVLLGNGADIYQNFPGTLYQIDWADGNINNYTLEQIKQLGGTLTHIYTASSCNKSVSSGGINYFNSYGTKSKIINPYCSEGAPTIDIARVFELPTTAIQNPPVACKNTQVSFKNLSTQGTYGNVNEPSCTNNAILFDWYVDGVRRLANASITTDFKYIFTTGGVHNILLVPVDPNQDNSELSLPCMPEVANATICIEEPPIPQFSFIQSSTSINSLKGCTPLTVIAKNESNTLAQCSTPIYTWTLINTATRLSAFNSVTFLNGTNEQSIEPQFTLSVPGNYTLTLNIKNQCTTEAGVSISRGISVVGAPTIPSFNYTSAFCEPNPKQIDFNSHVYNPNFAASADISYLWTITGSGDFEFLNGTSSTTAYPSILFKSYGVYTIKLDYTNGCGTASRTQTLMFNQPLLASLTANSSSIDISECNNTAINLEGSVSGPSGYTYQWTKSLNAGGILTPGPVNVENPKATYTPVSSDNGKQITFNLIITYPNPVPSSCAGNLTKSIQVTYTSNNTASPVSLNRCSGAAVDFMPESSITNSEFIWNVFSAGANISGQSNQVNYTRNSIQDLLINSGNTPQQVIYQITPRSAGGCIGTPFNLTVTVYPDITGNVISDNQTICANQVPAILSQSGTQMLNGGNGTYIYLWEQSTDEINWASALGIANQSTYQAPTLSQTTYYRRRAYSPDLTSCSVISNTISITINPLPDISIVPGAEICNTQSTFTIPFTNSTENPSHFDLTTGSRAMQGFINLSNVSFSDTPLQISLPANVSAGTYDFNLKVRNANGCESAVKTFTLIVKAPPTVAVAGNDQILCNNTTFTLAANIPAVGTGLWTIVGATNGALINNVSLAQATVSGLLAGKSVTLRWTIANGTCLDSSDEVVLTNVMPTPLATVGANQRLCNNINQAVLSANTLSGSFIGTWTDVTAGGPAGLTFTPNANTPGATVSGLIAGNEYKLRWTIAGNTPCGDNFAEIVIAVRPLVASANAGADSQLCDQTSTNNSFKLSANLDNTRSYETGRWRIISQPANSNASFTSVTSPDAILQNLIPGIYSLEWVITNDAGCSSTPDEVVIQVYAKPLGGLLASATTEVCEGIESGILNLSSYTGNIEQWEFATNLSGPWTVIANTTNTYTFPNLSQTTYFRVKVLSQGPACSASLPAYSNAFMVSVSSTTVGGTTSIGGNASVCQTTNSGSIILSDQVGRVTGWEYSVNGGSNWLPIANTANLTTYNFSALTQTTQFRALVKSGLCASAVSSTATITVLTLTQAVVSNTTLCAASTGEIRANMPLSTETGTWTQVSGPNIATFANINDPQTTVSGLTVGTYRFTWSINNGVCSPSNATLTLINYPALTNQIQTSLSTICASQTASLTDLSLSGGTGIYAYQWEMSNDNLSWTILSGQTEPALSLVLSNSAYFKRTVISGLCTLASNIILITVQAPISNNNISQNQEVCVQQPISKLTGTIPQGADGNYSFSWQQSVDALNWTTIIGANQIDYQPQLLSQTTWYRRLVSTALCNGAQQSISNPIQITVWPNASAEFTALKTTACIPFNLADVITVIAHPDLNASYEWFANNVSIGTGSTFPGYIISTDGERVNIKLLTLSKYGCDTDEKSISFGTVKSVTASFIMDKTEGCGPLNVNFTNKSIPINGANYAWDFGNGQTSVSANPLSINFQPHPLKRDTVYTISLKAYTDCQESVYTATVLVRPQPESIFTPNATEGCSPFKVNFTNQSKGYPNIYEFNFGDGSPVLITNSLADVEHTFSVLTTTIFNVTLKASNECGTSSSSYSLKVRPNTITANLVVNGNDKLGCPPHTITFYNNSVGANQFTWDFGDGSPIEVNAAKTMTHTFVRGGIYQVKLTATNGCSVQETSETVRVYTEPVSSFSTNKLSYCVNEVVQFENTSPIGGFVWDFGDGTTSTQVNPQHFYTKSGNYNMSLTTTVTQADGTTCSKTVTKQITISPLPIPQFTTNAATLNCAPFRLLVQNTSQNAVKFSWYIDDILVSSQKTPSDLWLTIPNKIYTIKLVTENALACTFSTEQKIQMYPGPIANFSVLPGNIIEIPEYTFNFQNNSTGNLNTYKWSFGDGSTSTLANPVHNYAESGVYQVILIAKNQEGCSDTLSQQVEIKTVPAYLFVANAFEPASLVAELKTFKPKGSGIAKYNLKIFNKMGSLLWESSQLDYNNSPAVGWDGTINGQPAPPDIYIWSIEATFINRTIWKGMKYRNSDRPKTTGSIHLIR